jgi:hypothetical protein
MAGMCWVYIHWKERVVLAAQPAFLMIFLSGSMFVLVSELLWIGKATPSSCTARVWVMDIFFTLAYGALVVKIYRVWLIFGNTKLVRMKITDTDMMKGLGMLVTLSIIPLACWSGTVNPVVTVIDHDEAYGAAIERSSCALGRASLYITLTYKVRSPRVCCSRTLFDKLCTAQFVILLVGCVLSYQMRNIDKLYLQVRKHM